jgi:hypothetical protein
VDASALVTGHTDYKRRLAEVLRAAAEASGASAGGSSPESGKSA